MFRIAILFSLLLPMAALTVGCNGSSSARSVQNGASFWVPAARESFVTIGTDTAYAVVPDPEHDVFLREVDANNGARQTWLLRVPRDMPLDTTVRFDVDAEGDVRAWLLEEVDGGSGSMVPASGSLVVHSRTGTDARATVVLHATSRALAAGRYEPETITLTHRGPWQRNIREPFAMVPKGTRSGAEPPSDFDPSDPYSDGAQKGKR